MKYRLIILLSLTIGLLTPASLQAQNEPPDFAAIREERLLIKKHSQQRGSINTNAFNANGIIHQAFDVRQYRLKIRLDPTALAFSGTVMITGAATALLNALNIDAQTNLVIEAVRLNGQPRNFERKTEQVRLNFLPALLSGDEISLEIDYRGTPVVMNRLGGGMFTARHGSDNAVVMATLTEPYGSPTWFPCIDDATDKATVEMEATVPRGFTAASNGILDKTVENNDQTTTFFWREPSPLSTYLISIAATNYARFDDTYTAMDGTRMPILFYVYPEHLPQAQVKFVATRQALELYAPLFGEYPFVREKYGMAEMPASGAMEHQTITSISQALVGSQTNMGRFTIAHEIAHHWWGDLVTMRKWNDLWLNEGFATYAEALHYEKFYQRPANDYMTSIDDGQIFGTMGGTVYAEDATDPFDDYDAVYDKGGWTLHMLRHIMTDERFFAALRDYAAQYAFSNTETTDFQRVCEAHYGRELDWFFQQWIYAPGRPFYKVSNEIGNRTTQGNYTISLSIKQKQSHAIPGRESSVYIMPLDVMIYYADGSKETRSIFNDKRKQNFTLTTTKQPTRVVIDEDNWVLKKMKG